MLDRIGRRGFLGSLAACLGFAPLANADDEPERIGTDMKSPSAEGPETCHRLACKIGDEIELDIYDVRCRAVLDGIRADPIWVEIPRSALDRGQDRAFRLVGYNVTLGLVSYGEVAGAVETDGI